MSTSGRSAVITPTLPVTMPGHADGIDVLSLKVA